MILTTRFNPDMDGVACVLAYEHFFVMQWNFDNNAVLLGNIDAESCFVLNVLWLSFPQAIWSKNDDVCLLDFGEMRGLPDFVSAEKVRKVIDHRSFVKYEQFPNAQFQVELVWSATTLIAEKFQFEWVSIEPRYASLLYCWTISNTLNFKAHVTSLRDIRSCERLLSKWADEKIAEQMLAVRSDYIIHNLEHSMAMDSRIDKINNNKTLNCVQLEVLNSWLILQNDVLSHAIGMMETKTDYTIVIIQDLSMWQTLLYSNDYIIESLSWLWFWSKSISWSLLACDNLYLRKELLPSIYKLLWSNL